jgi:hypothetical protein
MKKQTTRIMASTSSKTPCVTCGKGAGLFKCEGCLQTFCTKHVVEHRQTLHQQLDEIIMEHDCLQQTIVENKNQCHPLLNYIYEWEEKSIKKIQQLARETREKVDELENEQKSQFLYTILNVKFMYVYIGTVSEELKVLTGRIKKAREEDDFFETDLNKWISTLERLKHELMTSPLSSSVKEDQTVPLIYQLKLIPKTSNSKFLEMEDENISQHLQNELKLMSREDIFGCCLPGATIEDNGRLVIHSKGGCSVEVRGKVEYSSGKHRFRLQIDKNTLGLWVFFGIISTLTPMAINSCESSSAYGWVDYNDFFLAGVRQNNQITGKFSHTREKDIISLMFDCTTRKIHYMNERSQQSQQLDIDIKANVYFLGNYTSIYMVQMIEYACSVPKANRKYILLMDFYAKNIKNDKFCLYV